MFECSEYRSRDRSARGHQDSSQRKAIPPPGEGKQNKREVERAVLSDGINAMTKRQCSATSLSDHLPHNALIGTPTIRSSNGWTSDPVYSTIPRTKLEPARSLMKRRPSASSGCKVEFART